MNSYLVDSDRLASLAATGLMDSDAEQSYDRLSRLAARLLDTPTALVSLVDDRRQFFKSCHGLAEPHSTLRQTPVSHSFCRHVVINQRPLVINDSRLDPLVKDNPAVTDLGVIAYLGIPLTINDHVIGSFCVIDGKPRIWSDDDLTLLTDLSGTVIDAIRQSADRQGRAIQSGGKEGDREPGTSLDHSEARRFEESLRDAMIRLEAAQSVGAIATWTWDILNNSVVADANLAKLFSVSAEDALGGPLDSYIKAIHPDDSERIFRIIGETVAVGTEYAEEYRLVQPDGSIRWVRTKGHVIRDAEQRAIGLHGAVVDITEHKQSQQIILETEGRYRALVNSMDEGFCVIEMIYDLGGQPVDYRYIEVNQAFEKLTGMVDAVGKTIRELRADIESYWIEAFGFVVQTGEAMRLENIPQRAGDRRFEVYASPVGQPDQSRVALLFKDISELKRRDHKSQGEIAGDAGGNLRSTLSRLDDAVIVADSRADVVFINPAAEELCGWTVEAASGRPLKEVFRIPNREVEASSTVQSIHSGHGQTSSPIRRRKFSWAKPGSVGYPLLATSRMTGISPHALLVWERRYGFPTPSRSFMGFRRYSAQQVSVLTHMAKLGSSGRSIGEMINDYRLGILVF